MSRISRLVVLVASVAAVVGAMAGTASAVTWHVSGTGSFTATTGAGTLSATNSSLSCPGPTTATGAYGTGTFSPAYSFSGTVTFQGCNLAGQNAEVSCAYTLAATTQPTVTTITSGVATVTCGVTISPNIKVCHVSGSIAATYHNRASGADTLTLATTSTLNVRGVLPACPLGPNDLGHLNETTFTVTSDSGNGPNIVRTA